MKPILAFAVLFLIRAVTSYAAETTSLATKPNILIVYADDLGYGDVQCNNPERGKIPTPNIDKLAAEGMRFTDGHSSSGVCSPSRYTLLTGRYHWRTRLQNGIVGVFGEPLIASDRMTIGTLAQQQGYRTACIGKWHLGWDWPVTKQQRPLLSPARKSVGGATRAEKRAASARAVATDEQIAVWRDVFSKPIGGGPSTRGFDLYFGTDIPNWPPFCFIENDRTVGIPTGFFPAVCWATTKRANKARRSRIGNSKASCRRFATARSSSSRNRPRRRNRSSFTCRSLRRTRRWP